MEREKSRRDKLIEGPIMGLGRNLVLRNFPGIQRMTLPKTPSNSGKGE